jgi:ammonium transporter, Amt family
MKLDDAVGAIPVHLVNGWWGTICVALFHDAGFDIGRLGIQVLGAACISVTSFVLCYGLFRGINAVVPLRASDDEQEDGLDFAEHSANAYPDFQTTEQT